MTQDKAEQCAQVFLQATEEVLNQVLDEVVDPGQMALAPQPVSILEVAVILGLTGDQEGRVLFEFGQETALRIAGAMNFGETFVELDSMCRATLSELGNLVAGRAVTIFNDGGGNLQISPPILMCGMGMRSSDQSGVLRMCVRTSLGEVYVNLSVRSKVVTANRTVRVATNGSTPK